HEVWDVRGGRCDVLWAGCERLPRGLWSRREGCESGSGALLPGGRRGTVWCYGGLPARRPLLRPQLLPRGDRGLLRPTRLWPGGPTVLRVLQPRHGRRPRPRLLRSPAVRGQDVLSRGHRVRRSGAVLQDERCVSRRLVLSGGDLRQRDVLSDGGG